MMVSADVMHAHQPAAFDELVKRTKQMQTEDQPTRRPPTPLVDESPEVVRPHLGEVAQHLKALGQGISSTTPPQRQLEGFEVGAALDESLEIDAGPTGQGQSFERARILSVHFLRGIVPEKRPVDVIRFHPEAVRLGRWLRPLLRGSRNIGFPRSSQGLSPVGGGSAYSTRDSRSAWGLWCRGD